MNEPIEETNDGNAVEECPAPPLYYKLFPSSRIVPPVLPDIPNVTTWSASHQYNGSITAQMTNIDVVNMPSESFKAEMQSALLGIMTSGLAVVNDGGSHHRDSQVEVRIAPLNQAIQRMQSIMSAYQPHEARELLCLDMARQVQRLRDLKAEMTELLKAGNETNII